MNKTCIVLVGPTAVGKTAAAIRLAQYFKTEIISADSRQCFHEMKIGVARPSDHELAAVKHHFIDSHNITDDVSAGVFEKFALNCANEIFREHSITVMVGGTGLYVKAFCEGMDNIPSIPTEIRDHLIAQYERSGMQWLQQQVAEKDPLYFDTGEVNNPQRLLRALEVKLGTGKSIRDYQQQSQAARPFNIIMIGLDLPRTALYTRINERVDAMMKDGLLHEVQTLLPYKHLNALNTVGYKELFAYIEGETTLEIAVGPDQTTHTQLCEATTHLVSARPIHHMASARSATRHAGKTFCDSVIAFAKNFHLLTVINTRKLLTCSLFCHIINIKSIFLAVLIKTNFMRKIYLSFSFFLITIMSHAQLKKGDVLIGGTASFGAAKNVYPNNADAKAHAGSIRISAGKMLNNQTEFGVFLGYGHSSLQYPLFGASADTSALKVNSYNTGLYLRKYRDLGKGFSFFLQGSLTYDHSSYRPENQIASGYKTQNINSFNLSLLPGFAYRVSKHFQAELTIPSIATALYSHSKTVYQSGTSTQTSFTVASDLSYQPFQNVGIGFRFIL